MSRIHEALKRAAEERGTPDAIDAALPSVPRKSQSETADFLTTGPAEVGEPAARTHYLRLNELRADCSHPRWNIDPNTDVFYDGTSGAPGAEQFRTLRSRLYQLRANQSLQTVLVTSSIPGEGKTFVASNLAHAIARQAERSALVIDADLRAPRLHVSIGAPTAPGLSDYLRGDADELSIIQHGQEGNLFLVSSGSEVANPSELLSNGRLKHLLNFATPIFDWVIVDSPPCLPVSDTNILADLCDGVLLVVRAGSTRVDLAEKSSQELHRKIIGAVLNAVEPSDLRNYYYQYPYYSYPANGSKGKTKQSRRSKGERGRKLA
jgi:protein-tyrosine kinase